LCTVTQECVISAAKDRLGDSSWRYVTGSEETTEGMRQTSNQENSTLGWQTAERGMATKNLTRATEDETWEKVTTTTVVHSRGYVAGFTVDKLQEHL
jgi:hypothetical protein